MITMLKTRENGMEQISEFEKGCWINMVDPTTDDIEKIVAQGIPQDFITYPLDIDERARTEREDDGKMLVLIRTPYYMGPNVDIPYITIPLGIILTDDAVVTVSRRQTDMINDMATGRVRGLTTGKKIRFILKVLLINASKYLAFLREINRTVEDLEDRLQQSLQNKEVLELLKYQKSLVYFTTALKTNELLLERLQRSQLFRMYPDDEDLLEDVITENQQAIEMVNIASSILSGMMDAFASIISNNLNVVMKFLTSVTILLSLPTIITSFFGMNVALPLDEKWFAWLFILGMCIMLIGITTIIFLRRKWF